ncbi:hypothetical protein EII34_04320 [Arachnia propionica]|uniref:Uncharacterized protein n=1 Tax=Arachnia propionica TaxID=1750 RepID=A0A3P1TCX6_9ACTN|nr:hypothetical protein [Arachnia propionica]RRD06343.1 hypothetical protein EII34_04320 [Arachnia propionica]
MSDLGLQELVGWVEHSGTLSQFMHRPLGEEIVAAYRRHARRLHPRLHMAGLSARGAVLALRCDGALTHVLAGMRASGRNEFLAEPEAWESWVQLCSSRGAQWTERLVAAAGGGDLDAHPLLERLVTEHGLSEPGWFRLARLGHPDGVGVVPEAGDEVLWYRHLLEALDAMPQAERAETGAAVVEALTDHSTWHPWHLGDWAVPLLVRLGATEEQVLWRPREWPVSVTAGERERYHDEFLAAVVERGHGFAAEVVAVAEGDPLALRGALDLVELLVHHHDLPLPTRREYWKAWWRDSSTPKVGRRWQEQFLAACAVRDAMAPFAEPEERMREVEDAAVAVRTAGEVDDAALTGALIAVWERGDRVSSQRAVVQWVQALALADRLRVERARLIAVLPVLDGVAVTFVTELLLTLDLDEAELTEIALVVLPHGSRAVVRKVLGALEGIEAVSGELVETVAMVADGADVRAAQQARVLIEIWGGNG